MMKAENQRIDGVLSVLSGQSLCFVFRAMDMICFEFGDIITKKVFGRDREGKPALVDEKAGRYALHVQSYFRLSTGSEIILAKGDLYQRSSALADDSEESGALFDWAPTGSNRLDELLEKHFREPRDLIVERASSSRLGDLKIAFKNGVLLEVLPDVSGGEECWRFFEAGADGHLIVNGLGIDEAEDGAR